MRRFEKERSRLMLVMAMSERTNVLRIIENERSVVNPMCAPLFKPTPEYIASFQFGVGRERYKGHSYDWAAQPEIIMG